MKLTTVAVAGVLLAALAPSAAGMTCSPLDWVCADITNTSHSGTQNPARTLWVQLLLQGDANHYASAPGGAGTFTFGGMADGCGIPDLLGGSCSTSVATPAGTPMTNVGVGACFAAVATTDGLFSITEAHAHCV